MYQTLMFAMNLALLANNIGLMWVAIELATLTTVLMVGIYRTHEALEAAGTSSLGSVGIALALFGTILVYLAATPVVGQGADAMAWTALIAHAPVIRSGAAGPFFPSARLWNEGRVGAAARVAARCTRRRPDADLRGALRLASTSPSTPSCASNSPDGERGGLGTGLADDRLGAGLARVRGTDALSSARHQRMFAYSSIEHMGIITFAFGMGGPLASFAGLLHMAMHSLTKSAIFFAVGHIAQVRDAEDRRDPRTKPSAARLGPRIGGDRDRRHAALRHFMSEFLIITSTFARQPMLAILLVTGLLIGIGALVLRMQSIAFGEPSESHGAIQASYVPFFIHLTLVLAAGRTCPSPWCHGSKPSPRSSDDDDAGRTGTPFSSIASGAAQGKRPLSLAALRRLRGCLGACRRGIGRQTSHCSAIGASRVRYTSPSPINHSVTSALTHRMPRWPIPFDRCALSTRRSARANDP